MHPAFVGHRPSKRHCGEVRCRMEGSRAEGIGTRVRSAQEIRQSIHIVAQAARDSNGEIDHNGANTNTEFALLTDIIACVNDISRNRCLLLAYMHMRDLHPTYQAGGC